MRPPRKSKVENEAFYEQNSSSDDYESRSSVNTASKHRFELRESLFDIEIEPITPIPKD